MFMGWFYLDTVIPQIESISLTGFYCLKLIFSLKKLIFFPQKTDFFPQKTDSSNKVIQKTDSSNTDKFGDKT